MLTTPNASTATSHSWPKVRRRTPRNAGLNCATALARVAVQPAHGEAVSERVIRRLLGGDLEAPLQALHTLLVGKLDRLAPLLGPTVTTLVSHRDFAVAEAAALLANRWGIPVSVDAQPLPLFYKLELNGPLEVDHALTDERTGAMRVESELGWTQMLRSTAQALAKAADVDELTIRRRAAMFIQEWGGLEAFGPQAVTRLEGQLRESGRKALGMTLLLGQTCATSMS